MNRTELLYHVCEFFINNNSFSEKTVGGHSIVNKTTAKVFDLKNKLFNKLNK